MVLFTWEHDYTRLDGPAVRQFEHVFLARGPRREPVGDLADSHALDGILRWRWWPLDELARADEPLWPPQLPSLLSRLQVEGPPAEPVELGYVGNEGLKVRHLGA
jgi:hypothetical protein